MGALLSLIPGKDLAYGAAIITLLIGAGVFVHHERALGAAHELAALKASSDKLNKAADAKVAALTADHNQENEENANIREAQLRAGVALSAQLSSVRNQFDAYRRSHEAVGGAAGGPAAAGSGECGAQSCGDLASQLLQAGSDLARSNADLTAVLQSAQRDRDSLTGK